VTDEVQESPQQQYDAAGEDEKVRQSGVKLAATAVLLVGAEEFAVNDDIGEGRA